MTSLRYRFSKRIAELRRISGLKQSAFAEAIGLSLKEAGLIERGEAFPRPENLEPIAKALNVPLKELFDFGKTRLIPPPPALPTVEVRRNVKKTKQEA